MKRPELRVGLTVPSTQRLKVINVMRSHVEHMRCLIYVASTDKTCLQLRNDLHAEKLHHRQLRNYFNHSGYFSSTTAENVLQLQLGILPQ